MATVGFFNTNQANNNIMNTNTSFNTSSNINIVSSNITNFIYEATNFITSFATEYEDEEELTFWDKLFEYQVYGWNLMCLVLVSVA